MKKNLVFGFKGGSLKKALLFKSIYGLMDYRNQSLDIEKPLSMKYVNKHLSKCDKNLIFTAATNQLLVVITKLMTS